MSVPRFSIVTPSYNYARFLEHNIRSVLAQDYPAVEHIVVDNASRDGTLDVLAAQPSVTWISEPDSGQSDAVNKGIALSRHEWIVWLNADDFLLPGALQSLARIIEGDDSIRLIYSDVYQVNERGEVEMQRAARYSRRALAHWWWHDLQLWQPGTVFHREVFDRVGPLDESLHFAMDFDFFLKAQDEFEFRHYDGPLVAFRLHEQQKSNANEMPFVRERIRSTLRYWRNRSKAAGTAYAVLLYFVEGALTFVEGLRHLERGDAKLGRTLVWQGLCRNPLAWLSPRHAGFWLRRLVGSERYYRWRGGAGNHARR